LAREEPPRVRVRAGRAGHGIGVGPTCAGGRGLSTLRLTPLRAGLVEA
jgi:hypothetical protein